MITIFNSHRGEIELRAGDASEFEALAGLASIGAEGVHSARLTVCGIDLGVLFFSGTLREFPITSKIEEPDACHDARITKEAANMVAGLCGGSL